MTEVATRKLTFEEFVALNRKDRCELVNGQVEQLVSPRPRHGWSSVQFAIQVIAPSRASDPEGYWGGEVDIPTVPFHARRPDSVYYSSTDRAGIDLRQDQVRRVPTLAVEILSEEDKQRDLVDKRDEYARAGIAHYWILDPGRKTVLILVLRNGRYELEAQFSSSESLASSLFPNVEVPLVRLFPPDA